MNRRRFLCAAAAGPALLSGLSRSFAQTTTYDLIIRGGRVIDPSLRIDGIRDVAVTRGRIAAVETTIAGNAASTVDALMRRAQEVATSFNLPLMIH